MSSAVSGISLHFSTLRTVCAFRLMSRCCPLNRFNENALQAGMRQYLNGSVSGTPPPGTSLTPGRPLAGHPGRSGLMSGRASSSSLPRSPDNDTSVITGSGLGSASGQSGHGSLGSHSSHEVSYMNIYQNTNHQHIYVRNKI